MRYVTALLVGLVVAATAGGTIPPLLGAAAYLAGVQAPDGGFAETGRQPDVSLTAWAALGLAASRSHPGARFWPPVELSPANSPALKLPGTNRFGRFSAPNEWSFS